jgi:hypothetical protein
MSSEVLPSLAGPYAKFQLAARSLIITGASGALVIPSILQGPLSLRHPYFSNTWATKLAVTTATV